MSPARVAPRPLEVEPSPLAHPGRGRWLVALATIFWGGSAILAREVFRDHHVPPLTVVELRLLMSMAILAIWLGVRKPHMLIVERRDWPAFLILGLLGVAAIQGGYYYSISTLGVGLAILIQYLAPSLIVAYEMARGAKPTARTLTTVVAALAGTAFLVGHVSPMTPNVRPWQYAISFSTALTFAFYIVYSKRVLARYAPETILLYTFAIAGTLWAVVTPPWRILSAGYSPAMWGVFVIIALTSALIPFAFFYAGLRRLPPAEVGIIATLEPVVAVVAAAIWLHEGLTPLQWAGAVLVLLAAAMASLGPGRSVTPEASATDRRPRRKPAMSEGP